MLRRCCHWCHCLLLLAITTATLLRLLLLLLSLSAYFVLLIHSTWFGEKHDQIHFVSFLVDHCICLTVSCVIQIKFHKCKHSMNRNSGKNVTSAVFNAKKNPRIAWTNLLTQILLIFYFMWHVLCSKMWTNDKMWTIPERLTWRFFIRRMFRVKLSVRLNKNEENRPQKEIGDRIENVHWNAILSASTRPHKWVAKYFHRWLNTMNELQPNKIALLRFRFFCRSFFFFLCANHISTSRSKWMGIEKRARTEQRTQVFK